MLKIEYSAYTQEGRYINRKYIYHEIIYEIVDDKCYCLKNENRLFEVKYLVIDGEMVFPTYYEGDIDEKTT